MNQFYTAESVTEGHPDKLCDLIADSVLDECLSHDALSRVACEVMATRGQIIVAGEITSLYEPSIPSIVRSVLRKVGYNPARFAIQCLIHKQSPDIAAGVDCSLEQRRNVDGSSPSLQLGAGDQGIMVGYACSETPQRLTYGSRMEISSKLFKSLNTLTFPNLVTPVSIPNLILPSIVFKTP